MAEQTSGFLAKKLRQNWLNRFPNKPVYMSDEQDDSLTNLNWLQNISLTRFTNAGDLFSPTPVSLGNQKSQCLRTSSSSVSGDDNSNSTGDFLSSDVKVTYTQSPAFAQDHGGQKKQYLNLYSTGNGHARPSMLMSTSRQRLASIHQQPRNGYINYNPTIMSSYSQQLHHHHHHPQTPIALNQPLGFIPTTLVQIDGRQTGSTIAEPVLSVFHGDSRLNCTVDKSGHPIPGYVYPKLITRPGSGTLLTLPTNGIVTTTDTIDISSSGLFTTIDSMGDTIRHQYQTLNHLVPGFSRQQLIYMCMQELRRNKVTVDDIKVWVTENFAYYRTLQTNWQDEFRETMVASRCFQRVPRRKEEPGGKGELWRLNPEFQGQITKNRISSKFLNAWQTELPYASSPPPEKKEMQYSRRITVDSATFNSNNSRQATKQSPSFENLTSISDVQQSSAKRRCVSSINDLCQTSLTSNVYEGSSCSASSSSPPLSDLSTPPPQCVSDRQELSPLQNLPLTLSSRVDILKCDRVTMAEHNFSPSHISDPFYVRSELEPDDRIPSDVLIPPDFMDNSDLSRQIRDKCVFPESDTIAELTQACGLNEIPTLDINNIPDPLDLTIRGVSLKPPNDWWNSELSDSLSLLFNNNTPPPSSPNTCHELGDNLHETFHLTNDQNLPSGDGQISACSRDLENNPKLDISQQNEVGQSDAENPADAQQGINGTVQSDPLPYTQYTFLSENHLELDDESNWMDEQLNLEELDSFLGLA